MAQSGAMGQRTGRTSRSKWVIPAVAAFVVLALVAGLGAWAYTTERWPFSSSYRELGKTGVGVNAGAPDNIRAVVDSQAKPQFKQVQPLGDVTHITPDGTLPTEITLRFTLNRKVSNPDDVLIAYSRTGQVGSWELMVPSKVSDDGQYAYVKTTHLSWWQPLWRSVTDLVNAAMTELKKGFDALTGNLTAEAARPKCKSEDEVRDKGYSIKSAGDSLYWCLGWEGGKPVVKIVNKRRYPLLVGYPNFSKQYVPHADFGSESLAQKLSGKDRLTLFPFDEVHLTTSLKDGQSAAVGAEYNGNAQSLYQLEFGVILALNILDRFGAGGGVISNGKITLSAFDKVAALMGKFAQVKECGEQLFKLNEVNFGSIMSKCFSADTIMTVFGWKGLLLAPAMVAGPVVNFFRSQFNAIGDILNGSDRYALTLKYNKPVDPMARFAGQWRVHGSQVTYSRNMTGTESWNEGPCNYEHMCTAYAKLRLRLSDDGKTLNVRIVEVEVKDETGQPPFDSGTDTYRLGTSYTVTYVAPGHLKRSGDFGNPNLCRVGSQAAGEGLCGA